MLGMTFAFFNQGLFGKHIGKYLFMYYGGLALYYYMMYNYGSQIDKILKF